MTLTEEVGAREVGARRDRTFELRLEPPPAHLLERPLDYILADHFRQRSVCAALRRFAETGRAGRDEARRITAFLKGELALHHADEDEDLFPALRRRVRPEDELDHALTRLGQDHREAGEAIRAVIAALGQAGPEGELALGGAERRAMAAYAASEHRHLAIENGVVLAIARIRLTPKDLAAIARSMKARRGGMEEGTRHEPDA